MVDDADAVDISNMPARGSRPRRMSTSQRPRNAARRQGSGSSARHSFCATHHRTSPSPSEERMAETVERAAAEAAAAAAAHAHFMAQQRARREGALRPDIVHTAELTDMHGHGAALSRYTGNLPIPARAIPINLRQPGGNEVILREDILVQFETQDKLRHLYVKAREAHPTLMMQFELRCDKQAIVLYGGNAGGGTVAAAAAGRHGPPSQSTYVRVNESVLVVLSSAAVNAGLPDALGIPAMDRHLRAQSFPSGGAHGASAANSTASTWRGSEFDMQQTATWPSIRGGVPRIIFCVEPNVTVIRELAQRVPFSVRAGVTLNGAPVGEETGVTVDGDAAVSDIWEELVSRDEELEQLEPQGVIAFHGGAHGPGHGMPLRVAFTDPVADLRAFGVRRVLVVVDHFNPLEGKRDPEEGTKKKKGGFDLSQLIAMRLRPRGESQMLKVINKYVMANILNKAGA